MIELRNLLANPVETIPLAAVIDTALCVGAGGSSGSLADKPIVRTAAGNLLIPASQFKGRLRHECEKLARGLKWPICQAPNPQTMCPQCDGLTDNFQREDYRVPELPEGRQHHCLICQIFGNPTLPSRLICDDLICTEKPEDLPPEVLRPGVTLNRRRRTAEEQKLYFLETSPAMQLRFEGAIYLMPGCPPYAKALILAGLHHIHALGGSKSAGLGWLQWEPKHLSVNDEIWRSLLPGGGQ